MRIRPTSVTVIGWILVLTALFSIVQDVRGFVRPRNAGVTTASPVPKPIEQTISVMGTVMNFVCGYFLLKGKNWARYTEIVWSLTMLTYGYFTSPLPWMLVIGLALECVMIYLLFRPVANAYFAAENAGLPIANEMSKRQIASVAFYIASGFWLTCGTLVSRFVPQNGLLLVGLVVIPQLAFASILLFIGKLLSPNPNWAKEIGVVLLASAVVATMFHIFLGVFFTSTAFLKSLPPGKPAPEFSLLSAAIAVGVIAGAGALFVWVGDRRNLSDRRRALR